MSFDLVLQGGQVIDPVAGDIRRGDVAVADGRIAAVGEQLTESTTGGVSDTTRRIDVTGLYVTPGLIDMHTHVYAGSSYYGLDPNEIAWRSGVTTWIDAGSAGAYTLQGLRDDATRADARVHALLNISAIGLAGESYESQFLANCDVDVAAAVIARHPGFVVGIKARIDTNTVGPNGLEPLRRALTLAQTRELPLMVHVGPAPPRVDEIVEQLRPGDIVTHCASGIATGTLDGHTVSEPVRRAHERGVVLDLGHGAGGFTFPVAEALLAAGCRPRVFSSDLHVKNVHGPVYDLPAVLTKMLALGVDLPDTIAAATVEPARVLDLPAGTGTLALGAPADLATFELREGEVELVDVAGERRYGRQQLVNRHTLVAGEVLRAHPDTPLPPWVAEPS